MCRGINQPQPLDQAFHVRLVQGDALHDLPVHLEPSRARAAENDGVKAGARGLHRLSPWHAEARTAVCDPSSSRGSGSISAASQRATEHCVNYPAMPMVLSNRARTFSGEP